MYKELYAQKILEANMAKIALLKTLFSDQQAAFRKAVQLMETAQSFSEAAAFCDGYALATTLF